MSGKNDLNINIVAGDKSASAIDDARRRLKGLSDALRDVAAEVEGLDKLERTAGASADRPRKKTTRGLEDLERPTKKTNDALHRLNERNQAFRRFAESGTLGLVSRGIRGIGREAETAFKGVGRLSMTLGSLSDIGAASLGLAGIGAGGIAAAGLGIAVLDRSWASRGVNLANAGANIGIGAGTLDRFERAGANVGVSSGAMESGLQGLSTAAWQAANGLNPAAATMLRTLGVRGTDAQGHALGPEALLPKIADAIKNLPPQGQIAAVAELGMSPAMLPFLREGGAKISSQMAHLKAQGVGENLGGSEKVYSDFQKLETAAESVADKLAKSFAPDIDKVTSALTGLINAVPDWVKNFEDKTKNAGTGSVWDDLTAPNANLSDLGAHLYDAGADAGSDLGNAATWWDNTFGPASVAKKQAMKAAQQHVRDLGMEYFEGQGAGKKVAAGILGNAEQESSFNPDADSVDPRTGQHHRGLFQWDESRWKALTKWAGTDHPSAQQQYEYAWRELHEPEYASTLKSMQRAKNAGVAAVAFDNGFERSGDPVSIEIRRGNYAENIFNTPDSSFSGLNSNNWGNTAPSGTAARQPMGAPGALAMHQGVNGAVKVDITHANAPAGTKLNADATGPGVKLGAVKIGHAMPGDGV